MIRLELAYLYWSEKDVGEGVEGAGMDLARYTLLLNEGDNRVK